MNRMSDGQRNYLKVAAGSFADRFQVDDRVSIAIPEQVVLRGSFVVYMVPLFSTLLCVGAVAGLIAAATDLQLVAAALAGFLLGLGLVRLHAWRNQANPALHPSLIGPAETID